MKIFANLNKHIVIITEKQANTVRNIINETPSYICTYYRGCSYNEAIGKVSPHLLWLTPDDYYAKEYLSEPDKVIVEYKIDERKLSPVSFYRMDELFGYEIDTYDGPNEDEIKILLENGYNCYEMEYSNADGLCLFNTEPIVSKRILTDEEINNITEAIKVSTAKDPDANKHTTQKDFDKIKKCPKCGADMPFLMSIYDEHNDNDNSQIGRVENGKWTTTEYQAFGIWQCPKCFHVEAEGNMA